MIPTSFSDDDLWGIISFWLTHLKQLKAPPGVDLHHYLRPGVCMCSCLLDLLGWMRLSFFSMALCVPDAFRCHLVSMWEPNEPDTKVLTLLERAALRKIIVLMQVKRHVSVPKQTH